LKKPVENPKGGRKSNPPCETTLGEKPKGRGGFKPTEGREGGVEKKQIKKEQTIVKTKKIVNKKSLLKSPKSKTKNKTGILSFAFSKGAKRKRNYSFILFLLFLLIYLCYLSHSFFRSHAHFSKVVSTGLRSTAIFTFLTSRSGELIVMGFTPCNNNYRF
jgi:hypothetical protein